MAITWSEVPYSLGIAPRYCTDDDGNYAVLSRTRTRGISQGS